VGEVFALKEEVRSWGNNVETRDHQRDGKKNRINTKKGDARHQKRKEAKHDLAKR